MSGIIIARTIAGLIGAAIASTIAEPLIIEGAKKMFHLETESKKSASEVIEDTDISDVEIDVEI